MGRGNSESADAVIARASKVFVADKLSDSNKAQLDSLNVLWTELRAKNGYTRFKQTLEELNIPHEDYNGDNIEADLDEVFDEIFK